MAECSNDPGRPPTGPLADHHDVRRFDCGSETLNRWLRDRAPDNERRAATRTFVSVRDGRAVGHYSLAVGALDRRDATGRVRRHRPDLIPGIPAMLLACLAVQTGAQGEGIGRTYSGTQCSEHSPPPRWRAFEFSCTPSMGERRSWYRQFDFEESPTDPLQLVLLLDDVCHHLDRRTEGRMSGHRGRGKKI